MTTEPLGRPPGTVDPDETADPDFAGEHESTNFVDETSGGPERVEEEESPDGLAGPGS